MCAFSDMHVCTCWVPSLGLLRPVNATNTSLCIFVFLPLRLAVPDAPEALGTVPTSRGYGARCSWGAETC